MHETIFHPDGSIEEQDIDDIVERAPSEIVASLDPDKFEAVIHLASGLIDNAGPLWDALVEVTSDNTAKPTLDIIVDQVLTAALPLVQE
jgi:hypothetical protein